MAVWHKSVSAGFGCGLGWIGTVCNTQHYGGVICGLWRHISVEPLLLICVTSKCMLLSLCNSVTQEYFDNVNTMSVFAGSLAECRAGQFQCRHSGACIASHLRCDGLYQCGDDDRSDELGCVNSELDNQSIIRNSTWTRCSRASK